MFEIAMNIQLSGRLSCGVFRTQSNVYNGAFWQKQSTAKSSFLKILRFMFSTDLENFFTGPCLLLS